MANIVSYTNEKSTRSRMDCLGELEHEDVSVLHEHGGIPLLCIITRDVKTGRQFRIELSREETEAVMRVAFFSSAAGMNELRAKFQKDR